MKRSQQGVTMVEVLVSIVVVAIGILGLTALQGVSLRNTTSASLRSTASILAHDMADRMRSNPEALQADLYKLPTIPSSTQDCLSKTCADADMVKYDLWRWSQEVANTLPQGVGYVCLDSTPNGGTSSAPDCDGKTTKVKVGPEEEEIKVYAIKIWWDDDRVASNLRQFVMVVSP